MRVMRLLVLSVFVAGAAATQQSNTASKAVSKEEEMVKFVEEGAAYVKQAGKEAALKEFSKSDGKFMRADGELYIYAYDFNCVCLAHGYTPELVGRNLTDKKDSAGLFIIQKLRDTAAKDGKGFVEYGWNDPATGKEGRKLGYVLKVDETLWLGSGIYLKKLCNFSAAPGSHSSPSVPTAQVISTR